MFLFRWLSGRFHPHPSDRWFWPAAIYTAFALSYLVWLPFVDSGWGMVGYGLQGLVLGVASAALWAAYRYARIDVIMTDTWWMSSWARKTIVGAFIFLAVALGVTDLAQGHYWASAAGVVLNVFLAYYWWHRWGDGGRGWDEEDFPIIPDDPEDHGKELPKDPTLVELPDVTDRKVTAGGQPGDEVRGAA